MCVCAYVCLCMCVCVIFSHLTPATDLSKGLIVQLSTRRHAQWMTDPLKNVFIWSCGNSKKYRGVTARGWMCAFSKQRCRGQAAAISRCMSRIKITLETSDTSLKTQSNSTDNRSFYSRGTSSYWTLVNTVRHRVSSWVFVWIRFTSDFVPGKWKWCKEWKQYVLRFHWSVQQSQLITVWVCCVCVSMRCMPSYWKNATPPPPHTNTHTHTHTNTLGSQFYHQHPPLMSVPRNNWT